jgi:hypothetical protein
MHALTFVVKDRYKRAGLVDRPILPVVDFRDKVAVRHVVMTIRFEPSLLAPNGVRLVILDPVETWWRGSWRTLD